MVLSNLGLAFVLMMRPVSPELVVFPDLVSNILQYFYIASEMSIINKTKTMVIRLNEAFNFNQSNNTIRAYVSPKEGPESGSGGVSENYLSEALSHSLKKGQ